MRKMLLLLAALVCSLAGCGTLPADSRFEAGRYRGTAEGYSGPITVEVETDARYIRSIRVVDHMETAVVSDPAIEAIPAAVLAEQSLEVDMVAGCTVTSRGIVRAVGDALAGSCLDLSVLAPVLAGEAPAMARSISREADVIIIGAGGAGLSAAVEALRAGASVIVIEKQPVAGGSTILQALTYDQPGSSEQQELLLKPSERSAIRSLIALDITEDRPSRWQEAVADQYEAYVEDEDADYLIDGLSLFKLQTYVRGGYKADPELIEVLGNNLRSGRTFLEELGVRWTGGARAAVGGGWRRALSPTPAWGSAGEAFVLPQLTYINAQGGEVLYNMAAEELIYEEGRVTGVRGTCEGAAFEVIAHKGVILATGGYAANEPLRGSYNLTWPGLDALAISAAASSTGDGIVMAQQVGAARIDAGDILVSPTFGAGEAIRAVDNLVIVDEAGERFVREDATPAEIAAALLGLEGGAWALIDARALTNRQASTLVAEGWVVTAGSVGELADLMGLPADALEATVERFNRAVRAGGDPWGRAVFRDTLEQPPYYACKVTAAVSGTGGGLRINTRAQVLDSEGEPIQGLWAAGEVTGGLGGYAGPQALVFGRIAGKDAAGG